MKRFKNILYIFNRKRDNKVGLAKACRAATLSNGKLSITVVNSSAGFVKTHENEICDQIETLLSVDFKKQDVPIYFSYPPARVDIIKKVIADKYDLVVTEPDVVSGIKKFFYGTTTLALLRKCPCPVWVVQPALAKPYKKIMAAIDPASENPNSHEVTDNIIELAVTMAEGINAECHIVHAWHLEHESALDNPFLKLSKEEVERDLAAREAHHSQAFDEMIKRQTVDTSHCVTHLIKGDAKKILAEFAESEQFDLIVMGTLEKTDIHGFLIGHTAESLIHQIECSILAIKPASFISPIK